MNVYFKTALWLILSTTLLAETALSSTSRQNRSSRTAIVTGSLGLNPFLTAGVTGALVMDENDNAEISYYTSASNAGGTSRLVSNSTAIVLRHYFGNSFNMRLGAALRNLRINYKHEGVDGMKYGGVMAYASSAGAHFSIGNQWHFGSGFTIGCDWIGVYAPIAAAKDVKLTGDENLTVTQRKSIIEDAEEINMDGDALVTFLNIGLSF